MTFATCGAKTHNGMPCNRLVEAMGKRCYYHGGSSTGARTALGKLANGLRLRLYGANGAPKGHRKTDKARKRREAAVGREEATRMRQARRAKRLEYWRLKKKIALGLPLIPNHQD